MKTFKILFAAIIIAGFATTAQADDPVNNQQATGEITASAVIQRAIGVIGEQGLVFSSVSPGMPKTVDTNGNVTGDGVDTGAEQAGRFLIEAFRNARVQFSLTTPSVLTHTEEENNATIPISYSAIHNYDGDSGETGTTVNLGESNEIILDSEEDDFYVWIGGTVTPPSDAEQGTYEAEITLTAEYN